MKYFFVKLKQDLADEGYLTWSRIIHGEENLELFKNKKFSLCFGNLSNEEFILVKDCDLITIKEITKEEADFLLNIEALVSDGYWIELDDDCEELFYDINK